MDKRSLSERDICSKFISPALRQAGWEEMLQICEEARVKPRPATRQSGCHLNRNLRCRPAGSSFADLRAFPERLRRAAGYQLDRVQNKLDPDDWKPMPSVGDGVREIRMRD